MRGGARGPVMRLVGVASVVAVVGVLAGVMHVSSRRPPSPPPRVVSGRPRPGRRAFLVRRVEPVPRSTAAVPILMYHVIAHPFVRSPFPGLYVPPAEFAAQMDALAASGFHAVTLDRVRAAWLGRATLPAHPIVITFDNGYRTQYTAALPVLRRLGWVGVENLQLTGLPPSQGGLTTREVRSLVADGWELDTQGYDHADLTALDAPQLRFQISRTRAVLRRRYRVPVDWFCYPSGDYDLAVVRAVQAAGFVGSTTVVPGWARPGDVPYLLPRLRVLGGTTPAALLAQIGAARSAPPPPAGYFG